MRSHLRTYNESKLRPNYKRKLTDFICEDQSHDVGEEVSPVKIYRVDARSLEKNLVAQFGEKLQPSKTKRSVG